MEKRSVHYANHQLEFVLLADRSVMVKVDNMYLTSIGIVAGRSLGYRWKVKATKYWSEKETDQMYINHIEAFKDLINFILSNWKD